MMIREVLACWLCMQVVVAVHRPPHIYKQPTTSNIYYKPGESIEIPCVADGIPIPQYKWKRNGEDYDINGQNDHVVQLPTQGTIVFNRPESKDGGIYQCFADNGYGISVSLKIYFLEAKLTEFRYEDRETHTVNAGMNLTLPCTVPQSYPPADVYWVIKDLDGSLSLINFDERISMDIEGRLRFTNVKKTDSHDGKPYACMAINNVLRENATGPEHVIEVIGTTELKSPARELWTPPSNLLFVRGRLLKLKCIFAGNPTPDVYWEKLDGTLPDRATYKSPGQELQISDVQMSDAGQYKCMGLNTESTQSASKVFDINIESPPYWLDKPENVEASLNETATFICRSYSNDTRSYTTYMWYINGVSLKDRYHAIGVRDPRIYNNKRFSKPNENTIILTNLTLEDHMNIQCNASNKHGFLFADVYLNVLDKADVNDPTVVDEADDDDPTVVDEADDDDPSVVDEAGDDDPTVVDEADDDDPTVVDEADDDDPNVVDEADDDDPIVVDEADDDDPTVVDEADVVISRCGTCTYNLLLLCVLSVVWVTIIRSPILGME